MATRHALTLYEKAQLIREHEENLSYRTLTKKYNISIGSVSNIVKREAEYMDSYEEMKIPPRSAIYEMNPVINSISKCMNGS